MSARDLVIRFGGQVAPSLPKSASAASRQIDSVGDTAERTSKRSGGAFSALGSGVKMIAGPLLALELGGKAVETMWSSISEAQEARKVGATTAQIIKQTQGAAKITADGVAQLAESISNKIGVDDEAVQSSANLLLTFKNVKNEVGAGAKIFDRATMAAQDLAAAGFGDAEGSAKMLGKALNDPTKGITALSRAGVTFTDSQKKQIKALQSSGKLLEAQKIIMGEVESQVGGVAEKTATAGDKLKVMWGNTKEQLGTMLLPLLDKGANLLTSRVLPAVQGFLGAFDDPNSGVSQIAGKVSGFVGSLATGGQRLAEFGDLIQKHTAGPIAELGNRLIEAKQRIAPIVTEISEFVTAKFAEWGPTIGRYVDQVGQIVGEGIQVVAVVVQRITQGISYVWNRWGSGIMATASTYLSGVVKVIGGALNIVQGIVRTVLAVLQGDWGKAWNGIKQIGTGVWQVITGALRAVTAVWTGIMGAARDVLAQIWTSIASFALRKVGELRDGVTSRMGQAKDWALGKLRGLKDGAVGLFDGIGTTIGRKFDGIKSGIARPLRDASTWLNKNILSPMNSVTSKFGVNIPQIPKFHTGGMVPGLNEIGALLLGGEGVLSRRGVKAAGGPEAVARANRGEPIGGIGGPGFDWIKKPGQWLLDVGSKGVGWAMGKLFGALPDMSFPPAMAGQLLKGTAAQMKDAAIAWAKGKDQADFQLGSGTAATIAAGRRWPTNTRRLSGNYPGHSGVDIAAGMGAPIYAADAGRIAYTGFGRGYGNAIFQALASGGSAVYGHGSHVYAKAGDQVKAGQLIGLVGSTGRSNGPHLHYEVNGAGAFGSPANRPYTLKWLGYDQGGWLPPGMTPTVNATGKPEAVLTADQWERLLSALEGIAEGGQVVVDGHSLQRVFRAGLRAEVETRRAEDRVLR